MIHWNELVCKKIFCNYNIILFGGWLKSEPKHVSGLIINKVVSLTILVYKNYLNPIVLLYQTILYNYYKRLIIEMIYIKEQKNINNIRCTILLPPFFFWNSRLYCKKLVIHLWFKVLSIASHYFLPSFG